MSTSILNLPSLSTKQTWECAYGAGMAFVIAAHFKAHRGVHVVVAPDGLKSAQLYDEIRFFLNDEADAERLFLFPDWETLPYDLFSPHQDLISERLKTLSQLSMAKEAIVVSSVTTLMHVLCPNAFVQAHALALKPDQHLDFAVFRSQLQHAGYHATNKVLEHGEYAVRGSIMDIYPMGQPLPVRIELFDEVIESLRFFDPDTQRTVEKISALNILPAREFPLNEDSIKRFRSAFREQFQGNPGLCPLYESVSQGQMPAGIEYYLPLFFEKTASIFDYLPDAAHLIFIGAIHDHCEHFWQEANHRYEQRRHDVTRPILAPNQVFIEPSVFLETANRFTKITLTADGSEKRKGHVHTLPFAKPPQLPIARHSENPLSHFKAYIQDKAFKTLLMVESTGRREVLLELLRKSGLQATPVENFEHFLHQEDALQIIVAPLAQGVEIPHAHIALVSEAQLFGEQAIPQRKSASKTVDPDLIVRSLAELQLNAPVVHLQFGVGRYQGLQTIESNGITNEFLVLRYAGEDKIYVPVTALHQISRYTGVDSEHAPLHKLGSDHWQKAKKKAQEKIHDTAIELLDIYAKREAKPGHAYTLDEEEYERFAQGFPFTETQDQINAIHAIQNDMKAPRPMDRLICGDVGFGKTEVAMRAAFIAAQNGKQVCVLVPTTLLAGQHYENFRDRFAAFPITIELLSRFRNAKETQGVIDSLKNGKTDIVIGTHKLFSNTIAFKNLGLLIIDEEHRFGVKQKEHIKALRTHVDILSMTATPIPRTLNLSMAGIRDISLIATPPAKRLAVKTFWQEKSDRLIREAILREILRGGQVFYLHNDVQTIERVQQDIQTLVPEAKVRFAHGQMRERALETIMSDFYHHHFNVLICTTIIETGIDIPTANTIVIERADKFGLAQLHQLRGRVGRSHHQAYAYLLTPPEKALTKDAIKRLEAIVSLEDLGAGFTLATHDLEIRGAGELLGEEQSGNMEAIGFTLFMDLLDKAVADLKAGKTPELDAPLHQGPDIDLRISAIIPEDYIADIHNRLIFYKRIANAKHQEQLNELQVEMIDRFGLLPPPVKHLFLITSLKLFASELRINRIQAPHQQGRIEFAENPNIDPLKIISLIQVHAKRFQLDGADKLRFTLDESEPEGKIREVMDVLTKLRKAS